METDAIRQKTEQYLAALEERVDELIFICEQLVSENASLQTQEATLRAERDALIEKNEQARARIEAMVARLTGLGLPT